MRGTRVSSCELSTEGRCFLPSYTSNQITLSNLRHILIMKIICDTFENVFPENQIGDLQSTTVAIS